MSSELYQRERVLSCTTSRPCRLECSFTGSTAFLMWIQLIIFIVL